MPRLLSWQKLEDPKQNGRVLTLLLLLGVVSWLVAFPNYWLTPALTTILKVYSPLGLQPPLTHIPSADPSPTITPLAEALEPRQTTTPTPPTQVAVADARIPRAVPIRLTDLRSLLRRLTPIGHFPIDPPVFLDAFIADRALSRGVVILFEEPQTDGSSWLQPTGQICSLTEDVSCLYVLPEYLQALPLPDTLNPSNIHRMTASPSVLEELEAKLRPVPLLDRRAGTFLLFSPDGNLIWTCPLPCSSVAIEGRVLAAVLTLDASRRRSITPSSSPPRAPTAPKTTHRLRDLAFPIRSLTSWKDTTLAIWVAAQRKPTVINFWATWCPPCMAESPLLAKLAARHRDVLFIGIANETLDQNARGMVVDHINKAGITYPQYLVARADLIRHLTGSDALPSFAVFNAEGTLTGVVPNSILDEASLARLENLIASARSQGETK